MSELVKTFLSSSFCYKICILFDEVINGVKMEEVL